MTSQHDKFDLGDKLLHNGMYGPESGHSSLHTDLGGQAPSPTGSACSSVSGKDSSGSSVGSLKELTYTGLTAVDLCADMQNR